MSELCFGDPMLGDEGVKKLMLPLKKAQQEEQICRTVGGNKGLVLLQTYSRTWWQKHGWATSSRG